jgi:hypothetical protein
LFDAIENLLHFAGISQLTALAVGLWFQPILHRFQLMHFVPHLLNGRRSTWNSLDMLRGIFAANPA